MTSSLARAPNVRRQEAASGGFKQLKEKVMRKSALIIGHFTKSENVFTGKLETLGIKANLTLQPNDDKEKDNHPDFIVLHGQTEIGVAWERSEDRGNYISIAFEEPSLAPGFYTLVKNGAEKGYTLLYRKPMPPKKDFKK
jgi:uncharacterized protein (DUF736 family)